jgi:hypothetical protein
MEQWFKVKANSLTFKSTLDNSLSVDMDNSSVRFNSDILAEYASDQEAINALTDLMKTLGYVELVGTA